VKIPAGCTATTSSFRATAAQSIQITEKVVDYHWEKPMSDIVGTINIDRFEGLKKEAQFLSEVPQSLESIKEWIAHNDEEKLKREEEKVQRDDESVRQTFSWVAFGLGLLAITILSILGMLLWWWSRKVAREFGITIGQLYRHLFNVSKTKIERKLKSIKDRREDRKREARKQQETTIQVRRAPSAPPPLSETESENDDFDSTVIDFAPKEAKDTKGTVCKQARRTVSVRRSTHRFRPTTAFRLQTIVKPTPTAPTVDVMEPYVYKPPQLKQPIEL
jgi:hypothetical protein